MNTRRSRDVPLPVPHARHATGEPTEGGWRVTAMEGNPVLARAAPWPGEPMLPVSPDREVSEVGGHSRPAHAVIARALLWRSGNRLILLARPKGATSRLEP